jgi:hypothetical protein
MSTNGKLRIWFFAGPSLPAAEIHAACASLPAEVYVFPPVQQGDLVRCFHDLPEILGIIDGCFHQVPAVQHKEILLALDNGVRVLGAASLGALRAAELDSFGMEGIGEIYRLYKEGAIDGDDDVALVHASQEDGFRPLTEALVNVRHHLELARNRGVITARTYAVLLASAKGLHYTERTYQAVLQAAGPRLASAEELTAFWGFLRKDAVDLKREDALALVRTVAARVRGERPWPPQVPFQFQQTKFLRFLKRDYLGHRTRGRHVLEREALSFHKLLSRSYPDLHRRVALRCLAVDEALHQGLAVEDRESLIPRFRCLRGLASESAYRAWLRAHYLSEHELFSSLRECDLEARVLALYRRNRPEGGDDEAAFAALLADVAARVGVSAEELMGPLFMRPGILWEEPFVREIKRRGEFAQALEVAARILEYEAGLFESNPELKLTFDSLLFYACDHLENWIAGQWGVAADELETTLRKRGFVRYREFLEAARLAYIYAMHGPGTLFT